jgi:Kef-type K+ transport system membrane component KefB
VPQAPKPKLGTFAAYLAMIVLTVVLFEAISRQGGSLIAPPPAEGAPTFTGGVSGVFKVDVLYHVLLALIVVIAVARLLGALFRRIHQPPVIGEVIAGIILGPSLLGQVAPDVAAYVLPATVAPSLSIISQVGIILYMFLVGLELDTSMIKNRTHESVAISHASIILPFILGSAVALWIYPQLSSSDVPFTVFALFMGVSMSVTAFPVLARILTDRGIQKSRMGVIALTCAAVDDVTAWCMLAFVESVVQARFGGAVLTVGLTVGYVLVALFVLRPLARRLVEHHEKVGEVTQGIMTIIFVGLLVSSMLTDLIGIHALFGAFLLGAVIPHESKLAHALYTKLEGVVIVLFLPAFFAFAGMRTRIDLVSGPDQWAMCALIIVVASLGKFGGTSLAARMTGLPWRDSASLGILMNTRGLMQLIVLNIGLDLRVLTPTLFSMLVIMALVTTFATTPLLHAITAGKMLRSESEGALRDSP